MKTAPIDRPRPLGDWFPNRDKSSAGQHYPTGLANVDKIIRGIWSHSLMLIGGPPGHGKTVLGVQIGLHVASRGISSGLLSLEQPRWALEGRALSRATGIAMDDIVAPEGTQAPSWTRRASAEAKRLSKLPFVVDDSAIYSASRLYDVLVAWSGWGIKLAVVDYIQQVGGSESAVARVEESARAAKEAANKTGIAVVAISSLNRQAANRPDSTPRLSDLRESGALDFVADLICMFEYPNIKDATFDRRLAVLHILKNKNGRTGTASLWFERSRFGFTDREEREKILQERQEI